jgi:predicted RND superfamily exporter protein
MGQAWKTIGFFILKNRIAIIVGIVLSTVAMGFLVRPELAYDFGQLIPTDDPDYVEYVNFKKRFGEDGNAVVICFEGDLFKAKFINELITLHDSLKALEGVQGVMSLSSLYDIVAEPDSERFVFQRLLPGKVADDAAAAVLKGRLDSLPFYQGLILNKEGNATLVATVLNDSTLNSAKKNPMVRKIQALSRGAAERSGTKVHFGGMPVVRATILDVVQREMFIFLILAVIVTSISIFFFFRSLMAVVVPLLVIAIVTIWTVGLMGLFGYKITILSATLPSLITVISIPNAIYLFTKYHFEYRRARGKAKALVQVIMKIGVVTVITNLNTAAGFLVLGLSNVRLMKEFGIVAGISVTVTFFISLLLIPIILSYMPAPTQKQTKHIEVKWMNRFIAWLNHVVQNRRKLIYIISAIVTGVSIWGFTMVRSEAFLVDDIPRSNALHEDLAFLDKTFGGVLPFEIMVNTHRKAGISKQATLKRLEKLEKRLDEYPEISKALSIVGLMKFSRQALFSGKVEEYQLPTNEEMGILLQWIRHSEVESLLGTQTIYDSTYSIARVKANIQDVGSIRLKVILKELGAELDSLFVVNQETLKDSSAYRLYGTEDFSITYAGVTYANGEYFTAGKDTAYKVVAGKGKVDFQDRVTLTGPTKIFTKSNDYLIDNLLQNMVLALLVIALMMFPLFGTARMMLISIIPNVLPLVVTTAIMGFCGIPLKPSTALIYSMSFGIAIDNSIHFLARYRLARKSGDTVREAVKNSFEDTGLSMIYTSVILLFGFIIFAFSSYGGTIALGQLTSISLLIALVANLFLLPALLITFNKDADPVDEPMIDYEEEEEEDIEAMKSIIEGEEE